MILRALRPSDRDSVRDLLEGCEVFTKEEARVALEVLDEALSVGSSGGYILVGAEIAGKIRGYICAGSTPLTSSTWHLYWICVDSSLQGRGVGKALLSQAEETVRAAGGERLVVETSGQPAYQRARSFYQRAGYREVGRIPDFYKKEDDCVLYYRELATKGVGIHGWHNPDVRETHFPRFLAGVRQAPPGLRGGPALLPRGQGLGDLPLLQPGGQEADACNGEREGEYLRVRGTRSSAPSTIVPARE